MQNLSVRISKSLLVIASVTTSLPYIVARTKNHMIPVYLHLEEVRGIRKVTIIRHIEGDIWV